MCKAELLPIDKDGLFVQRGREADNWNFPLFPSV
jgi:hypothetical protein